MRIPKPHGFIQKNEEEKALKNGRLLTVELSMADECNIDCRYCYAKKKQTENQMSLKEYQNILDQSYDLGARNLHLSFRGESLLDKKTLPLIHYADQKGFFTLLMTNGTLITRELARELYPLNLSLLVKLNSLNPKIQDKLSGRPGTAKKIYDGLEVLLEKNFNGHEKTRIAIDIIILKEVLNEIPEMVGYSIKRGIWPLIEKLCVDGKAAENYKELKCSRAEEENLFKKLAKEFPGIEHSFLGITCDLWKYSITILNDGTVIECPMRYDKIEGNVKKERLGEIWKRHLSVVKNKEYLEKPGECPGKTYIRLKNS